MSIIEQAAKRLDELTRAGVSMPWAAKSAATRRVASAEDPPMPVKRQLEGWQQAMTEPDPVRRSQSAELDLDRLGAAGFLVPTMVRSKLATEFRLIKRPLLNAARNPEVNPSPRRNVIMVSSALPGEGKSFCSINLAMSIAMEVDSSVLLVDADVVRPSVLALLGLEPAHGLMDVLNSPETELSSIMLRTNVPKLTILPAGTKGENSTELLASAAMERLLDELASRYSDRIIVIDTPPLLLATESRVLAARGGQILLVVEEGRTQQVDVAHAIAALESCPHVYVMLNKARSASVQDGHGYYGYA